MKTKAAPKVKKIMTCDLDTKDINHTIGLQLLWRVVLFVYTTPLPLNFSSQCQPCSGTHYFHTQPQDMGGEPILPEVFIINPSHWFSDTPCFRTT